MSEETKLKVKDLPESEKTKLLLLMEKAGLRGAKTEYNVETAKAKVKEWQETHPEGNDDNSGKDEQNTENGEQNGENVNKTPETVNKNTENMNENTKNENKPANAGMSLSPAGNTPAPAVKKEKTLICHMCRGEVINGVCTKCGFTLKRG